MVFAASSGGISNRGPRDSSPSQKYAADPPRDVANARHCSAPSVSHPTVLASLCMLFWLSRVGKMGRLVADLAVAGKNLAVAMKALPPCRPGFAEDNC
jgi:hypothetical protein